MKIERKYEHRDWGQIGTVTLDAPHVGWVLDGHKLDEESVRHLLTFALQSLQDAYAGAESTGDAISRFTKKRDRLIAGTLGAGGGRGPALDAVTAETYSLLESQPKVAATLKPITGKGAAERRREILAKLDAKYPQFRTKAEKVVAERKALDVEIDLDN